jgi:hypothetical protein
MANDLARVVDPGCKRAFGAQGVVDAYEGAAAVEKGVSIGAVEVKPNDLARIIDAGCNGIGGGQGIIEVGRRSCPSDGEPLPKSFSRVLRSKRTGKHTLVLSLTGSYPSGHSKAFTRLPYRL